MSVKSYRTIVKNTSIFGGVQFFQIIFTLVKAKVVAVFLGSLGMGISGILMSTTNMVISVAGLGLNFGGVREISNARNDNVNGRLNRIVRVFLILTIASGVLGLIATTLLSSLLSQTAFGNYNYTLAFVFLSFVVLFNITTLGFSSIFQGLRLPKYVAKSNIIGSFIGLVISIPIYIFLKLHGIVPAIIISSFSNLIIHYYFFNKLKIDNMKLTLTDLIHDGNGMVKLGVVMMMGVFLGALATFIVNSFISKNGGLHDVGFYNAGMKLTDQYIGLIFTAMAMDYLPRLSAISGNKLELDKMVNQQAEIIILIITPLLLIFIIIAPIIVQILLSREFLPIVPFIRTFAVGMMFKAAVYSVGYIAIAKGDKWFFFLMDGVAGNITRVVINIIMYLKYGFDGLGFSFLIIFVISFLKVLFFNRLRYNFRFGKEFYRLFFILLSSVIIIYTFMSFFYSLYTLALCIIILIPTAFYIYIELDKRIDFRNIIVKFIKPK